MSTSTYLLISHIGLLTSSFGFLVPFYQARRDVMGCDALCYGRYSSTRSAVDLVGSLIITRASDSLGRKAMLLVGLLGTAIGLYFSYGAATIPGLYYAMLPGALLQHNFAIAKAYIADTHPSSATADDSSKTNIVGKLGMVVGLGFMIGPVVSGTAIPSFEIAVLVATALVAASAAMLAFLPEAKTTAAAKPRTTLRSFLNIKAARSPGALAIMTMRVFMALAFHVFITVWTPSLKTRFAFGPSDHGRFMSAMGLFYALSQGFFAPRIVKLCGNKTVILAACCLVLSMGRVIALQSTSLPLVYALFFCIITALGTFNTVITGDITKIAGSDDIGGVLGVIGSAESVAGMIGPVLGGELSRWWEMGPIVFVCCSYCVVGLIVVVYYESAMSRSLKADAAEEKKSESKIKTQ
jgi:MFS family permease